MYFDSKIIDSSWNTPATSLGVKGKFLKGVDTLLVKESTGLFWNSLFGTQAGYCNHEIRKN